MNQRPFLFLIGIIFALLVWCAASRVVPIEPPKPAHEPKLVEKLEPYPDPMFTPPTGVANDVSGESRQAAVRPE